MYTVFFFKYKHVKYTNCNKKMNFISYEKPVSVILKTLNK